MYGNKNRDARERVAAELIDININNNNNNDAWAFFFFFKL